jgi:hypothetical protein
MPLNFHRPHRDYSIRVLYVGEVDYVEWSRPEPMPEHLTHRSCWVKSMLPDQRHCTGNNTIIDGVISATCRGFIYNWIKQHGRGHILHLNQK